MSLDSLLKPASIAVVGASRDPAKLGHVLLKNVIDYGFTGRVYPVNPSGGEVLGLPIHASIAALPEAPDLVLLSIPNRHVPGVLREAASKGARAAVVLSSGFGEMGGEGASLQAEVRASGLRILGPNCMGVYHRPANLNATYFWELPRAEGRVAFVSQSGAYGGMTFRELGRRGVGISTFVSIGNQADVTHADVLEHLAGDAETEVVALFIEEVKDGRRFFDACRRVASKKAVVAFKVGRTRAGGRAAQSHTGSMAGDAEVCRAALRQAGAFVARETDEFFDALAAYAAYPKGLRPGGGLGIVTISGGPCVAAADACEEAGIAVPELSPKTQARVRALTPEFGAPRNPVDMTPQMDPAKMPECVEAVLSDPRVRALLAINVGLDRPDFADAFTRLKDRVPVVAFTVDAPEIARRFAAAGVPVFPTPERAVRALAALGLVSRAQARGGRPPARVSVQVLDENESKRLLAEAGIPVCRESATESAAEAERAARRLGYPVVLKALGGRPQVRRRRGSRRPAGPEGACCGLEGAGEEVRSARPRPGDGPGRSRGARGGAPGCHVRPRGPLRERGDLDGAGARRVRAGLPDHQEYRRPDDPRDARGGAPGRHARNDPGRRPGAGRHPGDALALDDEAPGDRGGRPQSRDHGGPPDRRRGRPGRPSTSARRCRPNVTVAGLLLQ